MEVQQLLVYLAFAAALIFLIRKFFGKKKAKKDCGNDDCGCN